MSPAASVGVLIVPDTATRSPVPWTRLIVPDSTLTPLGLASLYFLTSTAIAVDEPLSSSTASALASVSAPFSAVDDDFFRGRRVADEKKKVRAAAEQVASFRDTQRPVGVRRFVVDAS